MNRPLRLTILIFGLLSTSCTIQTPDMDRIMRQEGITEAHYVGKDGACLRGEYSRPFTGMKNGQWVSGVVCGNGDTFVVRYR